MPDKNIIPILIGGTGRSGTTILKKVLVSHPAIASISLELRVIVDPGGALDLLQALTSRWSPYNADYAIRNFEKVMRQAGSSSLPKRIENKLLPKLGIAPRSYLTWFLEDEFGREYYQERLKTLIDRLTFAVSHGHWLGTPSYMTPAKIYEAAPLAPETAAGLIREYFSDLFNYKSTNGQRTHWIDDTPYNLLHANELLQLFPNMKFIHIYRDFRDVLVSYSQFGWGGDRLETIARRLANIINRWFEVRRQLPEDSFIEMGLEEFATDPTGKMKAICSFTGLPFHESMAEGLAHFDVKRMHAGRWKTELPPKQLPRVMEYLEPLLSAYNYPERS